MRVSQVGINLIKSFEGCRLVAYKDAAGVPTIGYGHTMGVKMGQTITQSQAEQMFVDDVTIFSDRVASLVKVSITQNQFDALTSLAYNIGVGGLKTSTLLEYLNAGNVSAAANEFGKWIHAGGKVLQGLVRRRAAEVALFLKDAPAPVQSQLAQQSVDELAQQVIAGKLGSGDARRQALGARYDEVQAKVNQILGGSKPAAPAQPAPTTTYTIRSGDSLSAIAAKFGTTVQNLVNLNGIADPNKIYAGQVLKISGSAPAASVAPKAQPVYHKIVSGDSVSKIAAKYGTTVQNIVNLNGLKDANKIYAGQTLRVK